MDLEEVGGWPVLLNRLAAKDNLSGQEARAALQAILSGNTSPAHIAAFLVALRMKGETVEEISGLVDAMLDAADPLPVKDRDSLIDTCGTGGDRSRTINVSTAAAFVVAGAGGKVCKHGNRAVSSSIGSADVLETLGVSINRGPEEVAELVDTVGFGFCFAQRFHSAARFVGPIRAELGISTVFNILGPLANPARVRRQIIGVGDPKMAEKMIDVLANRESIRSMVVYGNDGLDELTTTDTSVVYDYTGGHVERYVLDATDFGLARVSKGELVGGDAEVNADCIRRVLGGAAGAHRDIVVLNAAAGLMVAEIAGDWREGVTLAQESIDSGEAQAVLDGVVAFKVSA